MATKQGCIELARLVGAGFLSIGATIMIVQVALSDRWSVSVGSLVATALLAGGAAVVWWTRPHNLKQARARGLAEEHSFRAVRCFQLEAVGDFGPHYVIELESGDALHSVLRRGGGARGGEEVLYCGTGTPCPG
jgi:hypothetical protein